MGVFNHSRFRFFDKNGHELMLKRNAGIKLTLDNTAHPDCYGEVALVLSTPDTSTMTQIANNTSMFSLKNGSRFDFSSGKVPGTLLKSTDAANYTSTKIDNVKSYKIHAYKSSNGQEKYPTVDDVYNVSSFNRQSYLTDTLGLTKPSEFRFPNFTFQSSIDFDLVSTGLTETQTIFVLVDNEYVTENGNTGSLSTLKEYASDAAAHGDTSVRTYINRFKLLFFIDQRKQSDFRFFSQKKDSVEWTDKHIMDLNSEYVVDSQQTGYSVNVGFTGEKEGVYQETLYVCLVDTSQSTGADDPGAVYPIGEIIMNAETEGEDERYRTLFTNFGIPDPKEYNEVFSDTNVFENLDDYRSINKHSKKVMLMYHEIFPYVGTYKALINAVKMLGYEDIFFKEWYKEVGKADIVDAGYVAYDMELGHDPKASSITNLSIEERIHKKKLNKLSMMYHLNVEEDAPVDQYGFPQTIRKANYYNSDAIVKLVSLRKWLEKYILGINCHIIDIGGEGIVFERYSTPKFGSFQTVYDYTSHKKLNVILPEDKTTVVLKDASANISAQVSTKDYNPTLADLEDAKLSDFCDGYFDAYSVFHTIESVDISSIDSSTVSIYYGTTFELGDTNAYYQLRATSKSESFKFGRNSRNALIDASSPALIIDEDDVMLAPHDLLSTPRNAVFSKGNTPVINIRKGVIKRYNSAFGTRGELDYYAVIDTSNGETTIDVNIDRTVGDSFTEHVVCKYPLSLYPPEVEESSTKISLQSNGYFNNKYSMVMMQNTPYKQSVVLDASATGITSLTVSNKTYGLRFAPDTVSGVPEFLIMGYNIAEEEIQYVLRSFPKNFAFDDGSTNKTVNSIRPEYILDILDGDMVFAIRDQQTGTNRDIVLTFDYDASTDTRKVYVKHTNLSEPQRNYLYNTGSSEIDIFSNGASYSGFVNNYNTDVDSAVKHTPDVSVNVVNLGQYSVELISRDYNGHTLSVKSNTPVFVTPQTVDVSIFGLDFYSCNEYNTVGRATYPKTIRSLKRLFYDPSTSNSDCSICVLEYTPKYPLSSVDSSNTTLTYKNKETKAVDAPYSIYDAGSRRHVNQKPYNHARVTNIGDRFDFAKRYQMTGDSSGLYIAALHKSEPISDIARDFIDSSAIFKRANLTMDPTNNHRPDQLLQTCGNRSSEASSYFNAYSVLTNASIVVYDTVAETPVVICPCEIISLTKTESSYFSNYDTFDEYRLRIDSSLYASAKNQIVSLADDKRYTFYVIPTWINRCNSASQDSSTLKLNFSSGVYRNNFKKLYEAGDLCKVYFSKTNTSEYKGVAEYKVISHSTNQLVLENKFYVPEVTHKAYVDLYDRDDFDVPIAYTEPPYYVDQFVDGTSIPSPTSIPQTTAYLWYGPTSTSYVDIHMDLEDESDFQSGIAKIKSTQENVELLSHINDRFTISLHKFDTNNALNYWWNFAEDASAFINRYDLYSYTVPVFTANSQIIITPNMYFNAVGDDFELDGLENNVDDYNFKWSVYKHIGNTSRELFFECYNKVLFMNLSDLGIYDVILTVYDRFGNKLMKNMDGIVTIDPTFTFNGQFNKDKLIKYTVFADTDGHGTVNGNGQYFKYDDATLEAVPNTNYTFNAWSDGNMDNPRTFYNIQSDISLTATFKLTQGQAWTITASSNNVAYGVVSLNGSQVSSISVNDGSSFVINATPNTGHKLISWSDGAAVGNPNGESRTLTPHANANYIATFQPITVNLMVSPNFNDNINGSIRYKLNNGSYKNLPTNGVIQGQYGDIVTLQLRGLDAITNYIDIVWEINGIIYSGSTSRNITLNNISGIIEANVKVSYKRYTITAYPVNAVQGGINVSYNGTLYKSAERANNTIIINDVMYGDNVKFEAVENSGYDFDRIVINNTTYTTRNVTVTVTEDLTARSMFTQQNVIIDSSNYYFSLQTMPDSSNNTNIWANEQQGHYSGFLAEILASHPEVETTGTHFILDELQFEGGLRITYHDSSYIAHLINADGTYVDYDLVEGSPVQYATIVATGVGSGAAKYDITIN